MAQLEKLTAAISKDRGHSKPRGATISADEKALDSIVKLAFEDIPADPTRDAYRQGHTLGKEYAHWFRAKFGNGRFRLFFRYSMKDRVIIYGWVNDEESLRTYGAFNDAYAVFRKMLGRGNPPDDWATLAETADKQRAKIGKYVSKK